jgi:type III secretion protein S
MQEMIDLMRNALWLVLMISVPPIAVATVVGLVVAIIQAATQIQEQTLPHLLKLVSIIVTLMIMANFFGSTMINFSNQLFENFPKMSRRQ